MIKTVVFFWIKVANHIAPPGRLGVRVDRTGSEPRRDVIRSWLRMGGLCESRMGCGGCQGLNHCRVRKAWSEWGDEVST